MSDAVAKLAPKKKPARKPKGSKPTPSPVAVTLLDDRPAGLEPLHAACETVREFIRSVSGWEDEEDAVEALAAVALLQRLLYRLEGSPNRVLQADGGALDATLDKLARRPRRSL